MRCRRKQTESKTWPDFLTSENIDNYDIILKTYQPVRRIIINHCYRF